jgi:hypothetical protein
MNRPPETTIKLYEDGTITVTPKHRHQGEISQDRKDRLKEIGKKKKYFALDGSDRRTIRCAGVRMFLKRKNSIKWFTLTFPGLISQKDANNCLTKFIDNIKLNYNANSYIIIKENHKSGLPHFHCLVDMPFINFTIINKSWCNTFRNTLPFSRNALTSGRKKTIDNIKGISHYIAKYISKSEVKQWNDTLKKYELVKCFGNQHETRIMFYSRNIAPKPKTLSYNEYIYFTTSFKLKEFKHRFFNVDGTSYCKFVTTLIEDNFTIMYLENFAYLPEMFDLVTTKKQKIPPKLYKKPDYIQPNINF